MPLIRLTADNADEVLQEVVDDFAEVVRNSGKSPAFTRLEERATELENLTASGVLEVEVILGEVDAQWRDALAKWLQIDETLLEEAITSQQQIDLSPRLDQDFSVVRIRSGDRSTGRPAGQRRPPILVVIHTEVQAPEKELKDAIFDAVQQHPLSLLLVPSEAGWAKALSKLASRDKWMCKAIGLELMGERDLKENLALSPWKEARPFMLGWSIAGSMGSLYEGLELALEKEKRSLSSKRTVLDQKAAVSQLKTSGNASEIIGETRGYIQKQFDQYKAESAKRMKSLIAPFDGSLSQEIEAAIKAFNEFDYEKKPKIFVVRVPADLQKHLLRRAQEDLAEAGRTDLMQMGEVFRRVQEEVEKLIESKGGPPTVVHFNYLSDHELTNLLDRSISIQRPYSGTLARRGPMDYFMAARRYQMIFFMMFSAFGLSFIRSYRQIMVPLTVLLLSFGLLNVINSTRKQEKETEELELEKARELLRAELRRSMNEVEKTWSAIVANHLASQQAEIMERIEASVSSFFEGATRKAADDKILQQRQMKGLDQSERKIAEATKKVQTAPQELDQLTIQLTELYLAAIRPQEAGARAPGVPGAAGTPRPGAAAAKPAVPAAAAAALEKLKGSKSGAGAPKRASAGSADLKKKLAEARTKKPASSEQKSRQRTGAKVDSKAGNAPKSREDVAQKAANLRKRAEEISKSSKASKASGAASAGAAASSTNSGSETGSEPAGAVSSKRAAVEKRVADLQRKMKEANVDKESEPSTASVKAKSQSDRGAEMKKKAEEIKRKMEAAEKEKGESSGLDKTVIASRPPSESDSET